MAVFPRVLIVLGLLILGQDNQDGDKKPLDTDAGQGIQAAVQIVGGGVAGNVWGAVGARVLAGEDASVARLDRGDVESPANWRFSFKEPLPIYHGYLDAVIDRRPLPATAMPGTPDWSWFMAFSDALRRSDEADLEMFVRAADRYKNVGQMELAKTPEKYRGKIITITGRLTGIRKGPAPRALADTIEHIYTANIVSPGLDDSPCTVTFTELPGNLEPGNELNINVTFHGYFLSLVRFSQGKKEGKKQDGVISPYLVGKTVTINAADEPLPLDRRYLDKIKDGRPLPKVAIDTDKKMLLNKPLPDVWNPGTADWGWYMAFNEALRRSDEATLDMFKKATQNNVTYAHLKNTPDAYRGKIITVTGKMTLIRMEHRPRFVPDTIEQIYTGYIITPTPGAPPFAFAFTRLPDGVQPAERLELNVTAYGYFLSNVRIPLDRKEGKDATDLLTPYVVGKSFVVTPTAKPETEKEASNYYLVVSALGGFVLVAVVVAVINIWFRRGDRNVQAKLAAMREKSRPFNLEAAEPEPPPGEDGIKPGEPPAAT